jgi:peptide/nickel transport system substrate-binding protein
MTSPRIDETDAATFELDAAQGLQRRSLLRLLLAGGAMSAGAVEALAQAAGKRSGTLTIGADADPIGLDPVTVTAFASYDFTALLYTGLLRWTPDMKVEPDLATGFLNPNDTTYIFRLRQGVKFHNGQPFTAEDVKHTFDRILDPASASPSLSMYSAIKSVTVVEPHTVKFELKAPSATFLSYLATNPNGCIVPRGVTDLRTKPVGTGPFVFESYEPGQQFVLKANPAYYEDRQPLLDTVVFKFFKDQSSLAAALRSKAIDMTWFKDPRVSAQIMKSSKDLVSAPGKTSRTFPVWFNIKAKPFSDVRVRRALSMATDRKAALMTVLGQGAGKVGAMVPESQVGGYDGVGPMPYYKHDPAGAKKLLAEAGFANGIDLGDYIVVAANALDVQCAQVLQQQWAAAGIKVAIKPMETAPLISQWLKGEFGIMSIALSWSPDPDAIVSRLASTHSHGKALGMTDTQLDKMIEDARTILEVPKRAAAYQQIQKHIADQAYILQIYQYPLRWEAWWNYVKGYVPLAANIRSYVRTTSVTKS